MVERRVKFILDTTHHKGGANTSKNMSKSLHNLPPATLCRFERNAKKIVVQLEKDESSLRCTRISKQKFQPRDHQGCAKDLLG